MLILQQRGNCLLAGRDGGTSPTQNQVLTSLATRSQNMTRGLFITRLMKSMLINRDTLPPYIPRVLRAIKIEPHNPSISKLHITWEFVKSPVLDILKLLEVCNYLGLFLRKHVHQSSQEGLLYRSLSKFPHPFFVTKHIPAPSVRAGAQQKSSSRKLRQGADD